MHGQWTTDEDGQIEDDWWQVITIAHSEPLAQVNYKLGTVEDLIIFPMPLWKTFDFCCYGNQHTGAKGTVNLNVIKVQSLRVKPRNMLTLLQLNPSQVCAVSNRITMVLYLTPKLFTVLPSILSSTCFHSYSDTFKSFFTQPPICLMLSMLGNKNSPDDSLDYFIFSQKIGLDFSCKLSVRRQFARNVKEYFLGKARNIPSICSLLNMPKEW